MKHALVKHALEYGIPCCCGDFSCTGLRVPKDNALRRKVKYRTRPPKVSMRHVTRILDCYHAAENDGDGWYHRAHTACERLASRHKVKVETVAGVVAALSPAVRWERNLEDAETVLTGSRKKVTAYSRNLHKARRIVRGETPDSVLGGRKVRTFYSLICKPWQNGPVCVDRHAAAVAGEGRALTDHRYRCVEAAYQWAAREAGILPHAMQAVTWTAWRERSTRWRHSTR